MDVLAKVIEEPEVPEPVTKKKKAKEETPEEKEIRLQLELEIRNTPLSKAARRGKSVKEIQDMRKKAHAKRVKEIQKQIANHL